MTSHLTAFECMYYLFLIQWLIKRQPVADLSELNICAFSKYGTIAQVLSSKATSLAVFWGQELRRKAADNGGCRRYRVPKVAASVFK